MTELGLQTNKDNDLFHYLFFINVNNYYMIFFSTYTIIVASIIIYVINQNKFINQINFNYNLRAFSANKFKYTYITLNKTNLHKQFKIMLKKENNLFMNKYININKDFLNSLSKFVDKKLNLKIKYRAKNNKILVDEIAKIIVIKTIITQEPILFKLVKFYVNKYKINKKELNIIKILITKYLICVLLTNYKYSIRVHKQIRKYTLINKLKNNNIGIIKQYSLINFNKKYSRFVIDNTFNLNIFIERQINVFNINKLTVLYLIHLYK